MDVKQLLDDIVEKSVDRYQSYAYATGVFSVTILALLNTVDKTLKDRIIRDLKEVRRHL